MVRGPAALRRDADAPRLSGHPGRRPPPDAVGRGLVAAPPALLGHPELAILRPRRRSGGAWLVPACWCATYRTRPLHPIARCLRRVVPRPGGLRACEDGPVRRDGV